MDSNEYEIDYHNNRKDVHTERRNSSVEATFCLFQYLGLMESQFQLSHPTYVVSGMSIM